VINWGGFRDALRPDFANYCDTYIGPLPITLVVTSGIRSSILQTALWNLGRDSNGNIIDETKVVTWARPGTSPHEFGMAIDGGILMPNGSLSYDYDSPEWQSIYLVVRASPTLHSGIDFPKGETDGDHIERYQWYNYKSAT
jgi:D-alanyl-D-alanine carboxypeptidase